MRNSKKNPLKRLYPIPTSFSQPQLPSFIHSSSTSSTLKHHSGMQNGGLWSVHNCSFLLLFPPHMFFCSSMSPSHRLQYFKAGCSVDCVYGLLAFWIRLLQRGSSRGHSSCPGYPPGLARHPPWAAVWVSAPPWSFPWAAWVSLHHCLEHLLLLPPLWPWCLQGCFSQFPFLRSSLPVQCFALP